MREEYKCIVARMNVCFCCWFTLLTHLRLSERMVMMDIAVLNSSDEVIHNMPAFLRAVMAYK